MPAERLTIIYDGECPFCSAYVTLLRLREAGRLVELVDARSDDPRVAEAQAAGIDLDEGMVILWGGRRYTGAQAVHVLALLSSTGGVFNRIQRWLFRSPRLASVLYPWLVRGRRLWLHLARRRRIGGPEKF
ncbi:Predicted thiol-disulfide oxidoreductase YuxK, DCC family [Paracoccus halophilus]|uniref:Predicted thiol-disulfide oxidoreductase YuxK, DCC family n=1 Tax=Paracoccus halophilus TaxID=376733 RepID=A0A099F0K9_9RHOB|nr:DUF393 domain-containing protein [Paracoccus halophilus]KGJ03687.1 hypothetical protein IT41_12920 [Paracoccus halophilus]SFA57200.1 Predicted thiol-disulfide oxidoreductase YuxK, DCC family [Paracoccus halophilus]